ncbi:hypothetical protein ACN47E_007955 [Coniothyrium glycines]
MAKVQGTAEDRFAEIYKLFQGFLDSGDEVGASIAVDVDGKTVLDYWGGYADQARSRKWEKDTIVNVWSTSKTATSLAALVAIDRGLLDPYEKVAKYWPEFAANGKENVQVRHLLSHASGLSGWQEPVTFADVCNVEKSTKLLEQQAPWWEPGTASGYHAQTMGHLVGGLISRVTGKSLKQFIAEDLAEPLGADFQLGAKEEDWPRVADIIPPPPMDLANLPKSFEDPDSLTSRTLTNPPMDANTANTEEWRRGEVGAANGHSNARAVAKLLSAISLGGTVNGTKLLSPETIELIFKEQQKGLDLVLGQVFRLGIGFGLTGQDTEFKWLPDGRVCTWGGWGGSIVIMDLDRRLTISYAMNKMENAGLGNARTKEYVKAIYKVFGVEDSAVPVI